MNCWSCNHELIWGGDHDGEDYCNDESSIVSNLSCPKCGSYVEVYLPKDEYRPDFVENMIESNKSDEPVCDI